MAFESYTNQTAELFLRLRVNANVETEKALSIADAVTRAFWDVTCQDQLLGLDIDLIKDYKLSRTEIKEYLETISQILDKSLAIEVENRLTLYELAIQISAKPKSLFYSNV